MPNDVSLHLGCAGFDRISPRAQVCIRPDSLVDRMRVTRQQLSVRTEQLLRDLLKALIQLAPEELLDRALGARHAGRRDPAEGTHLIEAHDLDLCAALR